MENVIDTFIREASKAGDWRLVLRYQWVLNAAESDNTDIIDGLMAAKAKGQ